MPLGCNGLTPPVVGNDWRHRHQDRASSAPFILDAGNDHRRSPCACRQWPCPGLDFGDCAFATPRLFNLFRQQVVVFRFGYPSLPRSGNRAIIGMPPGSTPAPAPGTDGPVAIRRLPKHSPATNQPCNPSQHRLGRQLYPVVVIDPPGSWPGRDLLRSALLADAVQDGGRHVSGSRR